jgi:hypothetical protein
MTSLSSQLVVKVSQFINESLHFPSHLFFIDLLALATDVSYKQFPQTKSLHPHDLRKRGVFCLGNHIADELAYAHLVSQEENPNNKIVIYGDGIRALNLIGRLEEYGVNLSRVVWVVSDDIIANTTISEVSLFLSSSSSYLPVSYRLMH